MYKKVESNMEFHAFQNIWEKACEEKGFTEETYHPDADHYLFYEENTAIGTVEFLPYRPDVYSQVESESDFSFLSLPDVNNNLPHVYEIDKLCLDKSVRGAGHVATMLHAICDYATAHDIKRYVVYVEEQFQYILRTYFGLDFQAVVPSIVREKHAIHPIVVNIEEILKNKDTFHWFKKEMVSTK